MEPLTPAQRLRGFCLSMLVVSLVIALSGSGWKFPLTVPGITQPVTTVTYVHDEKAIVPPPVSAALNELNAKGIVASSYPDDTTDGDDQVPDQYKVTLPAAKEVGIPCLVVQSGDRVLRTVKGPTTKQQVLEAAQ